MNLLNLFIQNFRNIEGASLDFPLPLPNHHSRGKLPLQLLVGRNAQGKTSLLEAIYFLATATSHRTHQTRELIRHGSTHAFIRCQYEDDTSHPSVSTAPGHSISAGFSENERHFRVDEVLLKRTSDLYGHLRAVFFSPEDLAFFTGGPATRRRILDLGMCQQEPQMVRVLLEYRKTLKQRNTLLRTGTDSPQTRHLVHAWDHELARLGAWVTFARGRYALDLLEKAQNYYQTLSNRTEHLQGAYRTTCLKKSFISMNDLPTRSEMETLYLSVLEQTFTRDLAQRLTLTGPHRDDLVLAIGEASAERYASQGQRRSIVLSLKLAERDLLSTPLSGEDTPGPCNPSNENLALSRCQSPILLVDDVTHEMDRERCRLFLELITTSGQVFLTFTEPEAHRGLIQEATIWEVEGGKVSRG